MLLTPANMQLFFTGLASTYAQSYASAPKFWDRIAMLKPSSTEVEKDGWMGKIPVLREWVGPRQVQNAAARSYTLENLPWELTLEVDKFKIMDDTYGIYAPMVQMMGLQAAKWPDYMLADMIQSNTALAYDGLPLFDHNHPQDVDNPTGPKNDNLFDLALTPDNFQSVRASMMNFKGEDGKPLGVRPNLLVVPPALEVAARLILNSTFIATNPLGGNTIVGSNENPLRGMADLLVVPELASTALNSDGDDTWYLFDTSKPIKPLLFQQRQAPLFVPRVDPADPKVFDEHVFVYGVEARGNVGITLPFLSAMSDGA